MNGTLNPAFDSVLARQNFEQTMVNQLLGAHLLRDGHFASAELLAAGHEMEDLLNFSLMRQLHYIRHRCVQL